MKKINLFAVIIVMIFTACSSAKKSTGVWKNEEKIQGKSFNNVFIVVMTDDVTARARLENDLAAVAIAKGYKAVKSMDVMAPTMGNAKAPTKDEIIAKVKASSCDAVFVASLLKKEEDMHYTQSTTAYSMRPYYSWGGNYYGYYSHFYPSVYTPGYYTKEKTYFMQSNLYEAATEELMWSVQSQIFEPGSLAKFSRIYTTSLVKQLEKEGLLKKK